MPKSWEERNFANQSIRNKSPEKLGPSFTELVGGKTPSLKKELENALVGLYHIAPEVLGIDKVIKAVSKLHAIGRSNFGMLNELIGGVHYERPKTFPVIGFEHIIENKKANGGKYVNTRVENNDNLLFHRTKNGVTQSALGIHISSQGSLEYTGPAQISLERKASIESIKPPPEDLDKA
jgi:hypothetical protein